MSEAHVERPGPPTTLDRDEFTTRLHDLKGAARYSYQALATRIGRPVSTVHGWCTGKHLPYPRDNDVFEELLTLLGVDDTTVWMSTLFELRRRSTGDQGAAATTNPYRGLEPFTEDDRAEYFGRETLTTRLVSLIDQRLDAPNPTAHHVIAVVGASGAGKTSLLRAGACARLRERPDTDTFCLTPGDDPLQELSDLAATIGRLADDDVAGDHVAGDQPDSPTSRKFVVVVDRFEVLLTDARAPILDATMEVLDRLRHRHDTAVIVGLRADFFHRASTVPVLLDGLQHDPLVVGPMNFEEATDCIVQPAVRAGYSVAPDLVVQLIAEFARHVEARGATEALPLLSHVLYLLAEQADDRHLTVAAYREIGGLEHALERSADDAYAVLTTAQQAACRLLFTHLVELDSNALPTRRTAHLGDIIDAKPTEHIEADLHIVVASFADRRLLTTDVDTVTISHEALLTAWPQLGKWIDDERHALTVVRRLKAAAGNWLESGEDEHALISGTLLDSAKTLLSSAAIARLSEPERRFVRTSLAAAERRAERDAQVLSRQLAMQATVLRQADPSLSAQIGLIAHETAPTAATRSVILSATSVLPGSRHLGQPGPTAVALSNDCQRLAVTDAVAGHVKLYERHDQRWTRTATIATTGPDAHAYAVALSADGRLLAVAGTDRAATLVDLDAVVLSRGASTGTGVSGDVATEDEVSAAAMAADGMLTLRDERHAFDGPVHTLSFDDTGTELLVGGTADGLQRWQVGPGPRATLSGVVERRGTAMSIATARSVGFAASFLDGTVELRSADGTIVWKDDGYPDVPASATALSPDGDLLVVGYRNGAVRAWRLEQGPRASDTGAADPRPPGQPAPGPSATMSMPMPMSVSVSRVAELPGVFASWVNAVAVSPSGTLAAAASSDGRVRIWDTDTWNPAEHDLRHPTVVTGVRFISDDELVTTAEDGTLRTWAVPERVTDHTPIWSADFDRSGHRLLTCSALHALVHDATPMLAADPCVTSSHRLQVDHELVAPDGDTLTGAGAISPDGTTVTVGTRRGTVLVGALPQPGAATSWQRLEGLAALVESVRFSHDGERIGAVDRSGDVRVWQRGRNGAFLDVGVAAVEPPALGVAFDPNDHRLAVASESGLAHLFRLPEPGAGTDHDSALEQIAAIHSGRSFALSVDFHPALPVLAVGNADRTVTLWSIEPPTAPTLLCRLGGPAGHPMSVSFSRCGTRLAAGSTGGSAWVWDTSRLIELVDDSTDGADGRPAHTEFDNTFVAAGRSDDQSIVPEWARLDSRAEGVYAVTLAPDGRHLVGAGPGGRIDRWIIDEHLAIRALERTVGDPVTEVEWHNYVPTVPFRPYAPTA